MAEKKTEKTKTEAVETAKPKSTPKASAKSDATAPAKKSATAKATEAKTAPQESTPAKKPAGKTTETAKPKAEKAPAPKAAPEEKAPAKTAAAAAAPKKKAPAKGNLTALQSEVTAKETEVEERKQRIRQTNERKKAAAESEALAAEKPNYKLIAIAALSLILVICLIVGICCGVSSYKNSINYLLKRNPELVNTYATMTTVGYDTEILGEAERVKPVQGEPQDGGLPSGYPKFGYTLSGVIGTGAEQVAARNALIAESWSLCSVNTRIGSDGFPQNTYNKIGADGKLYLNGEDTGRTLYKHTASVGMYYGDVADDEPAVTKRITMRPRGYTRGYGVTGLFAPAGEVIKVQMSEADMEATGGISIHIGQALYNGKANNIWTAKNQMQRFPVILNTMVMDKNTSTLEDGVYTCYIGSFIGGPIYICNETVTFTATVSGGIPYSHFILGHTTPEEFAENAKTSVPYFDLEVWDRGVLHSGPKKLVETLTYDDLYKAAVLWDKISLVSTEVRQQGIVFLYDPFVAAGAAVAFPGQGAVNCPAGWMPSSLNYKSFVASGAWGNMHEFNHNYQGWGLPAGGEVTNNALNLVEYSLFTKISSVRGRGAYGASGLGGWNAYTCPSWAVKQICGDPDVLPGNPLSCYATLLHSFGQDNFMQTVHTGGIDNYYTKWSDTVHQDMSYFATQIANVYAGRFGGYDDMTETAREAMQAKNYPMFVPIASVYQTGRSYKYDGEKRYTKTAQPFVIPYGEEYTVDLREYVDELTGSIVLPEGFSFRVKNVSQPERGSIKPTDADGVYTYIPSRSDKNLTSGKIIATIEITKADNAFKVDDVDLVLEFEQSHETIKWKNERTTYVYDGTYPFTSAQDAYEKNYAGYKSVMTSNNDNPTLNGKVVQNCNAEAWYIDKPEPNSVIEIRGKYLADEAAKYRIALRGRWSTALYLSVGDQEHFELAATYTQPKNSSNANFPNSIGTYKDITVTEAGTWIYYKAVLLLDNDGARASFIGVGLGKFTPEQSIVDQETGEVTGTIPESVSVGYVNSYRASYEALNTDFESDYFYTRKYSYGYEGDRVVVTDGKTQTATADCNYVPWDANQQPIENLFSGFTGEGSTGIHFASSWGVSESNPAVLAFDIGEEVTANKLTLYRYTLNNQGGKAFPSNFTLQGSLDGVNYFDMGSWTGQSAPAVSGDYTFIDGKDFTFRYYRLSMTSSSNGRIALNGLSFSHQVTISGSGDNLIGPDDPRMTYKGSWNTAQQNSNFGHIYTAKNKATAELEFEGTRFGIQTPVGYNANYEVYIDGRKIQSIELKKDDGPFRFTFISPVLEEGKHKVVIKCTGATAFDSFVIW